MLANRLREIRAKKGITQTDLAKRASISRAYLAKVEKGEYNPTTEVALRLSRVLETPLTEIFFERDVQHCAQTQEVPQ
jgi:putative transcriptional regulator